jgi:methyl-accepting chemotaxis protein
VKKLFRKLTITQTIIFLSGFLFSLQVLYGLVINRNLNSIGHHITQIETQYVPLTKKITLLSEYQLKQEIEFERALRFYFEINREDNAIKGFNTAKNAFMQLSNKINDEITLILNELAHSISVADAERSKKEFTLLSQHVDSFKSNHDKWVDEIIDLLGLLESQNANYISEQIDTIETHGTELEHDVIDILAEIEKYSAYSIHALNEEDHNALLVGIILVSISLLMAIILTKLVTVNLNEDLNELHSTIKKISDGDLYTETSSKLAQEFGINNMRTDLKNTMLLVQNGANEILEASNELAEVSIKMMKNINQQAAEIDLVAVAMTEMEATSIEVAHHAESTQNLTMSASEKAKESQSITEKAMISISNLSTSLTESSQNIQELDKHSTNITSVLSVIKGIADQTNLLALNAAIEAARAGEQGRGFAVVADEVRTLAQRTQDSTVEIEELVNLFTHGTTQAVNSMEINSEHGEKSHQAALASNQKIEDIQITMQNINDMNVQVATAAEEQSCTSQELSKNTEMISTLSADNVDASSRISVSSEQLASLANQLNEKMSEFKLV